MTGFGQDLRFAWRMLARSPGFTAVVVVVMGLGIGVNASIFTAVRGILLRPLPFPEPDRIMAIQSAPLQRQGEFVEMSSPDYLDIAARAKSFTALGAWTESQAYLTIGKDPERFASGVVTPSLFGVLGVRPILGRDFLPEEGVEGNQFTSVLISHRIWKDRLGSDPDVIGRTFRMNGRVRTVVGVMGSGFQFPETADFWIPLALDPAKDSRAGRFLDVVARLRPGVKVAAAAAEVQGIAQVVAREHPETNEHLGARVLPLRESMVEEIRPAMAMLMVAVGFVLLIACANVANLMLARASGRQRELGLRAALGAGRARIARQLLTESLLVALLGGVLGIVIAYWANDLILASIPQELPYWMRIEVDGVVLLYATLITLGSGILFGLAPLLQMSIRRLQESVKEGSVQSGVGRGAARVRNTLVVAEVALAMVLLVGAGLMIQSFLHQQEVRGALDPRGVLTGRVTLPVASYKEADDRRRFFAELVQRTAALPGVTHASAVNVLPMGNDLWITSVMREGTEDARANAHDVGFAFVLPGYFETMRINLIAGRDFTWDDDQDALPVAIVNQSAARELWPDESPIGKRFTTNFSDSGVVLTVVGMVADVRPHAENSRVAQLFVPHLTDPVQTMTLVVRTQSEPAALTPAIRGLLRDRDPDLPFYDVASMSTSMSRALWEPRLYTWLMSIYSILAVVLAAVGIYGVMAFRVAQRTQEIGIRMALGAAQGTVLRMVVGQGLLLAVIGLGIGTAGAYGLTRFMADLLFGVRADDPPTYVGVAVILALTAVVACWVPAYRASRVDPMVALRHE
jgi:putative ABC transport system permease protein